MGGHDHRGAVLVDLVQDTHDAHGRDGVEVAGRFVGKEDPRPVHHGPGNGNTLLFTAGQFMRHALFFAFKAHGLQDFRYGLADDGAALSNHLHGEGHVREDVFLRQQAEILEDHADAPPELGYAPAGDVGNVLAGHIDRAGSGFVFLQDQPQKSGLTRARGTHQERELTAVDLKADSVERRPRVLLIDLGDILKSDHDPFDPAGHGFWPSPTAGARAFEWGK